MGTEQPLHEAVHVKGRLTEAPFGLLDEAAKGCSPGPQGEGFDSGSFRRVCRLTNHAMCESQRNQLSQGTTLRMHRHYLGIPSLMTSRDNW